MTSRSDLTTRIPRLLLFGLAAMVAGACTDAGDRTTLPTESEPGFARVAGAGDVATALAVQNRHTPDLMNIPGVVGTGLAVEDGSPRIRVYLLHGNVPDVPAQVERVPVERVVTGRILAGNLNNPSTRERPAPNGFSLGHPNITAGTLGAIVRDGSGVCYALSNNHVLADVNNASIGDNALQPGPFDGGQNPSDAIGTLADYEPIKFRGNNTIDAAIARLLDASLVTASTPSYAYGTPGTSTTTPSVNMAVQKFGRTTGITHGHVSETNVSVNVCYVPAGPFGCAKSASFKGQIAIAGTSAPGEFSGGGDSGSLIVTDDGARSPVGLLYAGSTTRTLANPIAAVLGRFGVTIQTTTANCSNGGSAGNQAPTAGFTFSASGLAVSFTDTSSDPDGSIASRSWTFGDGAASTAQNPSHTYDSAGDKVVTLTVVDNDGASDIYADTITVSDGGTGGGIELTATGSKNKGRHVIDLAWTGASGEFVDVNRDGGPIATTANDGAYTDNTGNRGGATYTYEVCETGGGPCSDPVVVTF